MELTYIDVTVDPDGPAKLLKHSKGRRAVPVIVEDGRATVGYGGT